MLTYQYLELELNQHLSTKIPLPPHVSVCQDQLQSVIGLQQWFMGMELRESQHHISVLRPKVSVSQNPREWWKFAFECVRLYKYELGLQSVNQESCHLEAVSQRAYKP